MQREIHLPKKIVKTIAINIAKPRINSLYEIQPIHNCFDPNIANSPPNHFVELLKHRMENYYNKSG